jgi:N-terminal region of Chorein or VPS13
VNANLLNGKGEITAIEFNCSYINEELRKVTPYFEFESVHISKLSFHVHSWTNIRHSPVIIDIEHITVVLLEPLHFHANGRTRVRQVTIHELTQLMKDGIIPKPRNQSSYNLLDRIFDNLTIEIRSISITYQPMGIFKTRRLGPWTPPALLIQLFGIRWVSVNEYGQEETKQDMTSRHHHHHHSRRKDGTFFVYKKLETEYQISIILTQPKKYTTTTTDTTNSDDNTDMNEIEYDKETIIPIISSSSKIPTTTNGGRTATSSSSYDCRNQQLHNNKMILQWAIQRRIRDGEYMAVQIDCVLPMIEIVFTDTTTITSVLHFMTALQCCFRKDRAFTDPLRPMGSAPSTLHQPTVVMSMTDETSVISSIEDSAIQVGGEVADPSLLLDLTLADGLSESSDDDNNDDTEESAEVDYASQPEKQPLDAPINSEHPNKQQAAKVYPSTTTTATPNTASSSRIMTQPTTTKSAKSSNHHLDRPLLVFSNGMLIHEKFSVSVSVQEIVIRGKYAQSIDGDVQFVAKGIVTEAIWPPITKVRVYNRIFLGRLVHFSVVEDFLFFLMTMFIYIYMFVFVKSTHF